jgi:sugar phosphate isomerase/epimerase
MLIGAMNHPARPIIDEIRWMSKMGLEFVDLTLEPPAAAPGSFSIREVKKIISDTGLPVVGHTAYYLPFASPFESLRRAAVDEARRCLEIFSELGAKWMNLHPDPHAPFQSSGYITEKNLVSFSELQTTSQETKVGLMVENLPGRFNSVDQIGELLDGMPELGLHLDIGHSNLMVQENTAPSLLAAYGNRLRHVHLHDNKGGSADLHLPLGAGTLFLRDHIKALRKSGYDGTITLEVFSPDQHFLAYSRDVLRKLWNETAFPEPKFSSLTPA